ncbi:unnamed protein product [Amoebophrya sp. A25]|nr:unnamed protein product [Amoebophrya sp. A25]|eukprot:GSA25T00024208001.1
MSDERENKESSTTVHLGTKDDQRIVFCYTSTFLNKMYKIIVESISILLLSYVSFLYRPTFSYLSFLLLVLSTIIFIWRHMTARHVRDRKFQTAMGIRGVYRKGSRISSKVSMC